MPTKNIEPNLRLISEYTKLGNNDIFRIPEYQRGYSWTIVHCDKLWQDIESFINSNEEDPYFFGTIIIDCSINNRLNLIDGQQRTTTFLLLLKALQLRIKYALKKMRRCDDTRALERGLENSYFTICSILYKADEDSQVEIEKDWNEARKVIILENNSINELYKRDFQIIIGAETFEEAEKNVFKIARKQKDNKYTNFFRNFKYFHNKLLSYSESQLNIFSKTFLKKCQIIEIKSWQIEQAITMFNSLNSTGMPLSDADIISAQLYSNADNQTAFIEQWQKINEMANELSLKKVLNIDSVLQQFMYIERARSNAYKLGEVTTPGIRRYYTTENSGLLLNPTELCNAYEKILKIWTKIIDYPIIKLILKFNENFKLFLLPYLYRYDVEDIKEEGIASIVECFIRLFAIMEMGETGYSASVFKTFLFNENLHLVDPTYPKENIIEDFNSHIKENWKEDDINSDLIHYSKNVLVFLNEYLFAKENDLYFNIDNSTNVEHIMPASGHNIESIRNDADIETQSEFEDLVNQLGNKILLEENINKSISNDWFKTKKGKTIQSKQGYLNSSFGLASQFAQYKKDIWGKDDIKKYTEEAAKRICNFIFDK